MPIDVSTINANTMTEAEAIAASTDTLIKPIPATSENHIASRASVTFYRSDNNDDIWAIGTISNKTAHFRLADFLGQVALDRIAALIGRILVKTAQQ